MRELAEKYYRLLIRAASGLQSPFLIAIRLYCGWQFMQTGWGKLSDIHKVVGFFTQLGIPAPALNLWFVSGLEFAGGLVLIVGQFVGKNTGELLGLGGYHVCFTLLRS